MIKYLFLILFSSLYINATTVSCFNVYYNNSDYTISYDKFMNQMKPFHLIHQSRTQKNMELIEKIIDSTFEKMSSDNLLTWRKTKLINRINVVNNYLLALILTKIHSLNTGDTSDFDKVKKIISELKISTYDSDFTFLNLSKEDIMSDVKTLLKETPFFSKADEIMKELFPSRNKVEKKIILDNHTEIDIHFEETPENIETLHPDIVSGLKLLDKAYNSQPTNTVDVLANQKNMIGQPTYFLVVKSKGHVIGLMAIIKGNTQYPISVTKFGIDNLGPVQIEFGKILVLQKDGNMLSSMINTAISFLKTKNVDLDQTISFWVDLPQWAAKLKRMGAPEIITPNKNVWIFQATFEQFLNKYEQPAPHLLQEQI